jgi:hypothetical protein
LVLLFSIFSFGIYKSYKKTKKVLPKEKVEEIKREHQRLTEEISKLNKKNPEEKISEILTQTEATDDISVKGVEIIKTREKKIIRNLEQKYEIEIPSNMILARSVISNELHFFLPDKDNYLSCPGYVGFPSDLTIKVEENKEKLPLKEWITKHKKEIYLDVTEGTEAFFKEIGPQKIGENEWYKTEVYIERVIEVPTYEYFLEKDNKIYTASISEWRDIFKTDCPHKLSPEEMEKILSSFKFIP